MGYLLIIISIYCFVYFARRYPTSLPAGTGKSWLGIGGHALVSGCPGH